jgi:hypothetical protein
MRGRHWATNLLTPISILLLASCAQTPSPPPVVPPREAPTPSPTARPHPPAKPVPESPLEHQERERAQVLMHEGRWVEASTHWEILLLLRPDQQDYVKELVEARSRSGRAAAAYLEEAEQARSQGRTNRATTLYLKVLSAEPSNDKAAQALRDMERERARKANFGTSVPGGTGEVPYLRRSSKPPATPSTVEGHQSERGDPFVGNSFEVGP